MHWTLTIPDNFSLPQLIRRSHWLIQPPFSVNRTKERLNRVERLQSGNTIYLTLSQSPAGIILHTDERLIGKDTEEISQKTRRMLRLGEDLQPFLDIARSTPELAPTLDDGAHILRGATLFEDVVKAIIFTLEEKSQQGQRFTWIVDRFGDPLPSNPTRHAFPTPEQMLWENDVLAEMFPTAIADQLIRAAEKFCTTADRLEELAHNAYPVDELAAELTQILDLAPPTLGLVMLSLGRYDYIPAAPCAALTAATLDPPPLNAAPDWRARFAPLQPWAGLACWLRDWNSAAEANVPAGGGVQWSA